MGLITQLQSLRRGKSRRDEPVSGLPAAENRRFYPALDGLRAVAILMVFCEHYIRSPKADWGWAGVDIFFVLSGFLITGILYDTRDSEHRFRNFYVRRTLRIFPLYYGVLLAGLLLSPIMHWSWHASLALWPLYLGNYGRFLWIHDYFAHPGLLVGLASMRFQPPLEVYLAHFWSLCVEEQFYFLWPLIVFLVHDRRRLRMVCLVVCAVTPLARLTCLELSPTPYLKAGLLYSCGPLRADALVFGGLLALMLRGPEAKWLLRGARAAAGLLFGAFVVFEVTYRLIAHRFFEVAASSGMQVYGYTLVDWFAGAVLLVALQPGSGVYRVLTLKPLRRLGQISYGFYVFHDIPHMAYDLLARKLFPGMAHVGVFTCAIGFSSTLLLSLVSFRYFERPFLRLKDRFTAKSREMQLA